MKRNKVVVPSGNANDGGKAGFGYANANNAPSNTNTNIGSRLYFLRKNNNGTATAPLGEKSRIPTRVPVGA